MLSVEDRFMLKDLYRQGVSISELARRTGHDRKTVRRILAGPLLPAPRPGPGPRGSKLDPFKPYLLERIALGVLNAHKLTAEIQARGYGGQERLVRAFVHPTAPPGTLWPRCALRPPPASKPRPIGATSAPSATPACSATSTPSS